MFSPLARAFTTASKSSNSSNRAQYEAFLKKKKSNKLIQAGVPLILMVVCGSLFLSNFMTTHMEVKDRMQGGRERKSQKEFDLEEEHRKLLKQLDIDNYTLSRIPRPDEVAADGKPQASQRVSITADVDTIEIDKRLTR